MKPMPLSLMVMIGRCHKDVATDSYSALRCIKGMAQGAEAPVVFVVDGVEVPDPLFINEDQAAAVA